jgi:hypothetical protein
VFKNKMNLLVATAGLVLSVSAQANILVNEGFDNVAGLTTSGWVSVNLSNPLGTTAYFQGNTTVFNSQAGANNAYIAANYNNAAFSTANSGTVSFWMRGDIEPGFADNIQFGFVNPAPTASTSGTFTSSTTVVAQGAWSKYSVAFTSGGAASTARFGWLYAGDADTANYFGIDTLLVEDSGSVPVPAGLFLLGGGLFSLMLAKRRAS